MLLLGAMFLMFQSPEEVSTRSPPPLRAFPLNLGTLQRVMLVLQAPGPPGSVSSIGSYLDVTWKWSRRLHQGS